MERSLYRYEQGTACNVPECARRPIARGLCNAHYKRWSTTGDPGPAITVPTHCARCGEPRDTKRRGKYCAKSCGDRAKAATQGDRLRKLQCSVEACERVARAASGKTAFCSMHYRRIRLYGDPGGVAPRRGGRMGIAPCGIEGCVRKYYAKGLCSLHYNRRRVKGDVGPAAPMKAAPGSGTYMHDQGYVYVVHQAGAGKKGRRLSKIAQHRLVMEQLLGRPLQRSESVHHINGVRHDNRPENLELWSTSQPSGQRVTDKVSWAVDLLELYAPELLADEPTQLRLLA